MRGQRRRRRRRPYLIDRDPSTPPASLSTSSASRSTSSDESRRWRSRRAFIRAAVEPRLSQRRWICALSGSRFAKHGSSGRMEHRYSTPFYPPGSVLRVVAVGWGTGRVPLLPSWYPPGSVLGVVAAGWSTDTVPSWRCPSSDP